MRFCVPYMKIRQLLTWLVAFFSTMNTCQDKLLNCRITLYLSACTKSFFLKLPMKITISLSSPVQAELVQI